jgi:hypothetical protein
MGRRCAAVRLPENNDARGENAMETTLSKIKDSTKYVEPVRALDRRIGLKTFEYLKEARIPGT